MGDLVAFVRVGVGDMLYCWNTNVAVLLMRTMATIIKGGLLLAFFVLSNNASAGCTYRDSWGATGQADTPGGVCANLDAYYTYYNAVLTGEPAACEGTDGQWVGTGAVCTMISTTTGDTWTTIGVQMLNNDPVPSGCTDTNEAFYSFNATSTPSSFCMGSCTYELTGLGICLSTAQHCGGSYTQSGASCTDSDPGNISTIGAPDCVDIDGLNTCIISSAASGASDDCVTVNGTYLCDGVVTYADCFTLSTGETICDSAATSETSNTVPLDATTGEPPAPSETISVDTDGDGQNESVNIYTPTGTASTNPYSCDNPDTATWEPCEGYCDNPNTVINECVENSKECVDDPTTLFDETSVCHTADSNLCGGYMQPPCDANGNPKDTTGAAGEVMTADGAAIEASLESLADSLTSGWHEPTRQETTGYDMDGTATESDAKVAEYETKINSIKTEMSGMFSLSESAGTLPCWQNYNIPNIGPVTICPRNYESELSIVGIIVLLLGALSAVFIIFR